MTDVEITGRAGGYRDVAIRCPGCAEPMRQMSLDKAEAEVDVCDACGGMWVDWFDGEVRAIATETLHSDSSLPTSSADPKDKSSKDKSSTGPFRNEALAVGACPRCTRQLVPERYEMKAEVASARIEGRTSVVAGATGAELLRCEDCMGSFVSRSSAEVLSWLSQNTEDQPPKSQTGTAVLKPMPWDRLIALIKGLFNTK